MAGGLMFVGCAPGPIDPPPGCEPTAGRICTWAGTGEAGFDGDGRAIEGSRLYWPNDVAFTSQGAFVLDWNNHRVRQVVEGEGGALSFETVIGTDFVGDGPEDLSDLEPIGAPGTDVALNHPTQLHELPDGKLLLVAWHNHKLRTFDPATGLVNVICGRGAGFAGDGGRLDDALLNQPSAAVMKGDGTFYILDQRNQRIRYVDDDGVIDTVAGVGAPPGFEGDGGDPLLARFNFPTGSNPPPNGGLALDDDERLYIADTGSHRVRRIDFAANVIETVAGTGEAGFNGDDVDARAAQLNNPRDLTKGPDGRIYIADEKNHRVRALDPATLAIVTVAGTGEGGFSGEGGLAERARLNGPAGVSFDTEGNMYISDALNHRIRVVGAWQ